MGALPDPRVLAALVPWSCLATSPADRFSVGSPEAAPTSLRSNGILVVAVVAGLATAIL
jgi:hypothetical protein